jgi:hypothetical protein
MSLHQSDREDEETPLLLPERRHTVGKTPLPWRQLSIIFFLQLTEPITAQAIAPFAPQVRSARTRSPNNSLKVIFRSLAHQRCGGDAW